MRAFSHAGTENIVFIENLVDETGIEPATSSLRTRKNLS